MSAEKAAKDAEKRRAKAIELLKRSVAEKAAKEAKVAAEIYAKVLTLSGGQEWLNMQASKTATQTSFVALSLGKGGAIDKKIFKGKKFILDRDSLTEEDQTAVIETLRSFGVTKGRIVYAFTKAKNKAGK